MFWQGHFQGQLRPTNPRTTRTSGLRTKKNEVGSQRWCSPRQKNAGLFDPKFGSNMDKPKCWVKNV